MKSHQPFYVLMSLLCHCACNTTPATPPNTTDAEWQTYHNERAAYSLRYPADYALERDRDELDVRLRWQDAPIINISFANKEQSKEHGLWARHEPVGEIALGGKKGLKYIYNHCDGPFCMRTISYVVAHKGGYIGLAFRTEERDLPAIYSRVVESFAFN